MAERFQYNGIEWQVCESLPIDAELTAIIKELEKHGKEPVIYTAVKVLKSGKLSKQGGTFYRFIKSGNFVKFC